MDIWETNQVVKLSSFSSKAELRRLAHKHDGIWIAPTRSTFKSYLPDIFPERPYLIHQNSPLAWAILMYIHKQQDETPLQRPSTNLQRQKNTLYFILSPGSKMQTNSEEISSDQEVQPTQARPDTNTSSNPNSLDTTEETEANPSEKVATEEQKQHSYKQHSNRASVFSRFRIWWIRTSWQFRTWNKCSKWKYCN